MSTTNTSQQYIKHLFFIIKVSYATGKAIYGHDVVNQTSTNNLTFIIFQIIHFFFFFTAIVLILS